MNIFNKVDDFSERGDVSGSKSDASLEPRVGSFFSGEKGRFDGLVFVEG